MMGASSTTANFKLDKHNVLKVTNTVSNTVSNMLLT
jgi:hypothetical protein